MVQFSPFSQTDYGDYSWARYNSYGHVCVWSAVFKALY